ncbi:MAG: cobaltochelatase subunit CobN, partial [Chloroflexota bacterium]
MKARTAAGRKTIVFVTTADTDILTADRALAGLPKGFPRVRAYNPASLSAPEARDELLKGVGQAQVVVLRLLGGKRAMPESFDPLVRLCRSRGIPLIACPGHQEWDEDLVAACSAPAAEIETAFAYLMQGGVQNFQNLFLFLSDTYLGSSFGHQAPASLPWEGIYHPDVGEALDAEAFVRQRFQPGRPSIGVLFYRAHWMSGNLQFVDDLIRSLEAHGANVLPVFSYSLRHNPEGEGPASRALTEFMVGPDGAPRVHCIINTMGLAMSELSQEGPTIASGWSVEYLERLNVPIIQGIVSTGSQAQWQESSLGLGPIDTAMNVALPEFDGRIISVPISFKEELPPAAPRAGKSLVATRLQRYVALPDRVDYLARLAIRWASLQLKPNGEKRIAIILSNYPTKDARIGNAVGL